MPNLHFTTHISGTWEGAHYIRTTPLSQLVGQRSLAAVTTYMITGAFPTAPQERVLNAILVASVDNGLTSPSGYVPRVAAASGNTMIHAMAAGLLAMGDYHGGAVTGAAAILEQVKTHGIESLRTTHLAQHRRIHGLGHPQYKLSDPRADQLIEIAKAEGLPTIYQSCLFAVQKFMYEEIGKHLPINIDGAIAAILLDMGFPPAAGSGLFAVAKAAGMIAHILEEYQEKPVRMLADDQVDFQPEPSTEEA
jgi:citrate synthase